MEGLILAPTDGLLPEVVPDLINLRCGSILDPYHLYTVPYCTHHVSMFSKKFPLSWGHMGTTTTISRASFWGHYNTLMTLIGANHCRSFGGDSWPAGLHCKRDIICICLHLCLSWTAATRYQTQSRKNSYAKFYTKISLETSDSHHKITSSVCRSACDGAPQR